MSDERWLSTALLDLVSDEKPATDLHDRVLVGARRTRRLRLAAGGVGAAAVSGVVVSAAVLLPVPGRAQLRLTTPAPNLSASSPAPSVSAAPSVARATRTASPSPSGTLSASPSTTTLAVPPAVAAPAPLTLTVQGPTAPVRTGQTVRFAYHWSVGEGAQIGESYDYGDHAGIGGLGWFRISACVGTDATFGETPSSASGVFTHSYEQPGTYTFRLQIQTGTCAGAAGGAPIEQSKWGSWTVTVVAVSPSPSPLASPTATVSPTPTASAS